MAKKKKLKKDDYIQIRPFDREFVDYDYLDKLSPEEHRWLLNNFTQETLGAKYKDKGSIYTRAVLKDMYKKIKENDEQFRQFNSKLLKENESRKRKKLPPIEPIAFIKLLQQRENSKVVWERREDAFATFFTEIGPRQLTNKDSILKASQLAEIKNADGQTKEEEKEEKMSWAVVDSKPHEDVDFFLHCRKIDRLDLFIYTKILELVDIEKNKRPYFLQIKDDLVIQNKQFENKTLNRTKYLLFLKATTSICHVFCRDEKSKTIVNELNQIFDLIIYPYKNQKLQGEK